MWLDFVPNSETCKLMVFILDCLIYQMHLSMQTCTRGVGRVSTYGLPSCSVPRVSLTRTGIQKIRLLYDRIGPYGFEQFHPC